MTPKRSPTEIGKRLKAARVAQGISLRGLEAIIGVSFSALARIERGIGSCTPDVLERITKWAMHGESSEKPKRRSRPWIMTVEQRLARIEQALGIANDTKEKS